MQVGFKFYLAATLVATAAIPAQAAIASTPVANATAPSETSLTGAEKKICKRVMVSGSRLSERVCLTKSQWKKVEAEG